MQDIVSRFAPSPTGLLHLGHAWSALCAHDIARKAGGRFILRIEDIDQGRCRAECVEAIYRDLAWLGIEWDGPVMVQSQRYDAYRDAFERLSAKGVVYKCWCTRSDLAASASAPHGDAGPIYPGTCKHRADPGDGQPYCWRLDVAAATAITGPLSWIDDMAGPVVADAGLLGDTVLIRKDVPTSYHLAVTVDDAAQNVTHIVRGNDLFSATHIHRILQALLGYPSPVYHHHRLIADESGTRLAKRLNAVSVADMRASGIDPKGLVDLLRRGLLPEGYHWIFQ